ncbi:MAG: ABC transporter substrate-binding protein [Rhodospirillaceae bacterium]|jgi:urea transport system substrate-binding protein|nr:ABC transporter substrate-binding protein [Rhodospirillaceae bacterium]
MSITRRSVLKGGAAVTATAAAGFPHIFVKNLNQAWGAPAWVKEGEPIKVGVLFSQTGNLAVVENDSTNVVLYAIEEINKNGGVMGTPIEPVVVDAKSDIKVYSEKISELILRDRVVSVFGGYTSASRRAVMPIVFARDHLFYYPTCYEGRECMQNVICTGPLANQHSYDLIPFMVENFGPKVYLIGSNYIWPKESNKNAKVWLERVGGEVVGEDYVPLGGSEFTPIFNKVRQQEPDFIFSTVVGDSDIALHKQFKQEGFNVDTMPIAALTTGEIEIRAMGAEFGAGHFLSAPYFQTLDNPTNQKFVENYLGSKYGTGGVTHYNMEETYLSVYAWKYGLEKAIEQAGWDGVTPRLIRDVSGGIRIEDDISPEGLIWIDPDNFNAWLKPKIGQCQSDGQFKIVKAADEHVAPDPFSIYPERGVCKADGLHTEDGKVLKNVL